jgi:hypothetical protein
MMTRRHMVAVLAACLLCGCTAAQGQESKSLSDQQLGIRRADGSREVPFYAFYSFASDLDEKPVRFKLFKETGIRMIGSPVRKDEEPGILQCARNGIQVAGILSFNGFGRTMDLDGFRKYVHKSVRRYGLNGSLWAENPKVPAMPIKYWLIWGEPGTELKPPGDMMPDEAYAKALKVAHEEIKGYDPKAKIVAMNPIGSFGSLPSLEYVDPKRKIMGAYAFIRGVHAHGGFPYYDCIDIHPFSQSLPSDTAGLGAMLTWLKEECRKHGEEKPIWLTEIGFAMAYGPAKPFNCTKDQAADYMVRCMVQCARHNVQALTLTYPMDQYSPRRKQGYFLYKAYGFYKGDKMRPIGKATKMMIDVMPDPKLLEVISDGENISPNPSKSSDRPYADSPLYCYKFRGRGDSEVFAVWTEGRPFHYRLKVPGDKVVLYNRELLGGIVYSKANGSISKAGEIKIAVSGVPLLISTAVTPEQEKATKQYLSPANYKNWKPIRGAED